MAYLILICGGSGTLCNICDTTHSGLELQKIKLKGEQIITHTDPELTKMKVGWEQDITYLGLKQ